MTVTLGFLVFMLFLANTFQLASRRKILRELDGLKTEARAKALPTDDVEIKAYLEAQATTSPLAKRLLAASSIEVLPSTETTTDGVPAWRHKTSEKTPSDAHWMMLFEDFLREPDDESKLRCAQRWIENGNGLTHYEKVALLKEVDDAGVRDRLRVLLYPKAETPVTPPTPQFRWSKQAQIALMTITCHCGKPASTFQPSLGSDNTYSRINVKCSSCKEYTKRWWPADADTIYIEHNGVGWRYHNNKWIKAAID